ncbi:MAG: hypothetical protein ACOYEL_05930 [Saccharofermentanales bacterium]
MTAAARRDYEMSCNYMGNICAGLGEEALAEQYCIEGIQVGIALVNETNDPDHWDDLAVLYFNCFRMTYSQDALIQAHVIWSKLSSEHPENETYRQRFEITQQIIT